MDNAMFDLTKMELEKALVVYDTNEKINRAEGDVEQANLEAAYAVNIRLALAVLAGYESMQERIAERLTATA